MNRDSVIKVKRSKPVTALDGIIAALLAVTAALCAWLVFRTPASVVTVRAPNYERTFPLDADAEIELDGLTVCISDGEVWVANANCPDKTCEHTGKISRSGQSIVCLPNGVTVTISGEGDLAWEVG